ncbi:MAG TPA: sigma 54-interacting transcriptional regulator [Lamprocystis sp. (in: g-proteobacteria)]|nr:sigma 54-interacting transcriptional regulator [Lamprocystis sp. (in: g-proteobacteria)]
MNVAPLALVSFDSTDQHAAVGSVLTGLGYMPRVLSSAQVCAGALDGWPEAVVYLVEGPGSRRDQLLCAIARAPALPSLALVVGGDSGWDPDLIARCGDCAQWPCGREELGFRLGRLCASAAATPSVADDPELARTLADLNLVGRSPAFLEAMADMRRLIRCEAPVLVVGETGTGKELVARAVHYLGARSAGPFVPVNCGALPDHLVENELFGHERGAYTDAKSSALGAIGEAAGGTLFLDEVEALSPKAQAALLRFLQDREYRPLGARQARRADTRVVAASNADLRELSERRAFRSDLYFRLDILRVTLPPLRTRGTDIEILAAHFADLYAGQYGLPRRPLEPRCLPLLRDYPWPGNVRELEHLVHRQVLLADGPRLFLRPGAGRVEVGAAVHEALSEPGSGSFAHAKARAIASFERAYLTRLMEASKGNVSQAARLADKERRALGKLLKKYAIATG